MLDTVQLPGERVLEISPDRTFGAGSMLPVAISGIRKKMKQIGFRVLDANEPDSTDPANILISAPDAAEMVVVRGLEKSVQGDSLVFTNNERTDERVIAKSDALGRFETALPARLGDILRIDCQTLDGVWGRAGFHHRSRNSVD